MTAVVQNIGVNSLSEIGFIEFALRRLKTDPSTENKISAIQWIDQMQYIQLPRMNEIIKSIKSAINNDRYDTAIGLFVTQISHILL